LMTEASSSSAQPKHAAAVTESAGTAAAVDDSSFPKHDIAASFNFAREEEIVLQYWKDIDAFQESLRQSKDRKPYSFYDGPPFATGLPHYGHLLMGTVKDVVTRFAHSNGYHVERRFGWDTHGVPVESEFDKKLSIKSRSDVMALGIDRYNAECRAIVMRYASEWRSTVERMGRWIDFDNDYKTLNASFMESVWWVFKQLWQKGAVYQGLRVMPYSTALTTPLSNFEAGLDYRDVMDPAVTVAFQLVDQEQQNASVLAWTTTPWTLPSNLALCVHPEFTYLKIHDTEKDRIFYIHEKLLTTLYKDPKKAKYKKLDSLKGKAMVGWTYKPLFPYFYDQYKDRAFRIISDTYVKDDSGTGIVHQAPAFGDEDHRIAIDHGIIRKDEMPPMPLDDRGRYTAEVGDLEGMFIKDADKVIMKKLKESGHLIVQSQLNHSYPFCWRSGTPLLQRAISVWFVSVEPIRDQLVANNEATRWVPQEVGDKRFTNWLKNARDWNVSRNRYWGTPLPVWVSDDGEEMVCVGSVEELNELSGCGILTDLHRETVDGITIPSKKGKGRLKRVDEVFDCWFESGSMPYAQNHYPFENKQAQEATFPADFIAEAMDQTRGWFYTLLVLATHLFQTAPWKNLIVCGLVLAEDGKKMSKSLKNYPDPNLVLNQYGADALRLFLINSPVVRGDNLRFREAGVKEVISRVLLPWLNSFRFFLGQVALLKKESDIDFTYDGSAAHSSNIMDRWILARCQSLIQHVGQEMAAYRLYTVVPRLLELVEELTNWYIRFNRKRLKGESGSEDAVVALTCLFEALLTLCRTLSSFTPFLAEHIYQTLRTYFIKPEQLGLGKDIRSIHFVPFPVVRQEYFDPVIERQVKRMQTVIELVRTLRDRKKLPLKTPLKELVVHHQSQEYLDDISLLSQYIEEEINVRTISCTSDEERCGVQWKLSADFAILGRKLRKDIGKVKNGLTNVTSAEAKLFAKTGKITVAGIDLAREDLGASLFVENPPSVDGAEYESGTDGDVVILVDCLVRAEYVDEALARELASKVQKARKEARLQATDDVDVYISSQSEEGSSLMERLLATGSSAAEVVVKILKLVPRAREQLPEGVVAFWESSEEQPVDVGDAQFGLAFVKH